VKEPQAEGPKRQLKTRRATHEDNAKLVGFTEGWHGKHHRRVAELEIQTKDSPFVGGKPSSRRKDLRDLDVGGEGRVVTIEVTPVPPRRRRPA
jgi:hypothetical protein